MKDYSYIIDEQCNGKRTPILVRKIIPILVRWAKNGETDHTYGDLNKLLGYQDGRNSSIGSQLGAVEKVLNSLEDKLSVNIPTLNALVANSRTGLPSEGFSYVYDDYDKLDTEGKKIIVDNVNNLAVNFDRWDWVLALLGLKPALNPEDETKIRSGAFGGGEGEEHKRLKEYVASHSELLNIETGEHGSCEHILLSGDRLDVYFPKANVAVEVKPKQASDADILRGLFQCVKYKAILNAEAEVKGIIPDAKVVLCLGGSLSDSNRVVQDCLTVNVIERVNDNS